MNQKLNKELSLEQQPNSELEADKFSVSPSNANAMLCDGGKFIVSSIALMRFIYQFITPLIPEEDDFDVTIKCVQNALSFNDSEATLDIEPKKDFCVKIEIAHLRNLFRVLTKIPEQPLVLTLKQYDWIQVDGMVL